MFDLIRKRPFSALFVIITGAGTGLYGWMLLAIWNLQNSLGETRQGFAPFSEWRHEVFNSIDGLTVIIAVVTAGMFVLLWWVVSVCFGRWLKLPVATIARSDAVTTLPVWLIYSYNFTDVLPRISISWAFICLVGLKALMYGWLFWRSDYLERYSFKHLHWVLVTAAFVVYASLSLGVNLRGGPLVGPVSDEVTYLLMSHSLGYDRDLILENNFVNRDYYSFYPVPQFEHAVMPIDGQGQRVSYFSPGFPAFILPVYAIGSYRAILLLMGLITALLMGQVFLLCSDLTRQPRTAFLTWATIGFSSPILLFSSQVFPETLGALCTIAGVRYINAPGINISTNLMKSLFTGAALSILPWLHLRYLSIQIFLLGLYLIRYRKSEIRRVIAFVAPIIISLGGYLWFNEVMYGTPSPIAQYEANHRMPFSSFYNININSFVGIFGILFDQEYGLLPTAPVYLFLLYGVGRSWITDPWNTFTGLILFTGSLIQGGLYVIWSGAMCLPARFLVVVIPLLSIAFAAFYQKISNGSSTALKSRNAFWSQAPLAGLLRRGVGIAWLSGYIMALTMLLHPEFRYNAGDGTAALFEWLGHYTGVNVVALFPSFFDVSFYSFLKAGILIGIMGTIALLTYRVQKSEEHSLRLSRTSAGER